MSNGLDLWIAGALVSIGAHMMAVPAEAERHGAPEPRPGIGSTIASLAAFLRTLLLFGFTLSVGFVWYETTYWVAVLYVTAALPGVMIGELFTVLRRRRGPRSVIAMTAAVCLLLGPAIAGFGVYRLVGDLARFAASPAS